MNAFQLRAQLDRDFICALLSGLARKACTPDDALGICPVALLTDGPTKAVYGAVADVYAAGAWPTLPAVFEHLSRKGIDVPAADISAYLCSSMGHEAGVKHFAAAMRRECVKLKAETAFAKLVAEAQRYANDPNDWLTEISAIVAEIEGGNFADDESTLNSVLSRVVAAVEAGNAAKPQPTPWSSLNRVLKGGFVPGEMVVLAARPGLGKTAFAGCVAVETARTGKGVLFVSREVKDTTIGARLLAREGRIDNRYFRQGIEDAGNILPAIRRADATLRELPLSIVEKSTVPMTPREVRRLARNTANIGLVVVDYLQLLNPDDKHSAREREVAEMSRAMKQLALDCSCPVLVLSQLNRSAEDADRCPGLHDLRESGAIEQDADIVIFLHTRKAMRALEVCPVQVEVAKGRSSGTGTAHMLFEKPFSDFREDGNPTAWKAQANRNGGDDL